MERNKAHTAHVQEALLASELVAWETLLPQPPRLCCGDKWWAARGLTVPTGCSPHAEYCFILCRWSMGTAVRGHCHEPFQEQETRLTFHAEPTQLVPRLIAS